MRKQIYIGDEKPKKSNFRKPPNTSTRGQLQKPDGGLWTSSETPESEYLCEWHRFCTKSPGFTGEKYAYRIYFSTDANPYKIDSLDDLEKITVQHENISSNDYIIDLQPVRQGGYNGIQLTDQGVEKLTTLERNQPSLYGWDVESTVWIEWVIESVEYISTVSFD